VYFAATWTVDPYGVSPVQVSIPGFNAFKVKRLDIDRAIKPLEILQKQPRTIFVGSSRIHQSIDTAVLEGTDFAPAYNAAIPANELSESVCNIELAFALSPGIKHVFVELFFYNFARGQARHPPIAIASFASSSASLLLSFSALWASVSTVYANVNGATSTAYVAPTGHWVPPQGFRSALTFDAQRYTDSIIDAHSHIPDMLVQPRSRRWMRSSRSAAETGLRCIS
jgi:hypothetical protein